MKRALASALLILMLVALLCAAAAEDSATYYGEMKVVNCKEWVSLRDVPGTGGNRLAKVPLGATVTEAEWRPLYDRFIYCRYNGQYGYILSEYLEETEPPRHIVLKERVSGVDVLAFTRFSEDGERMTVSAADLSGAPLWEHQLYVPDISELEPLSAFLAGTVDDPLVMVYRSGEALTALDLRTGEPRWSLSASEVNLGASISFTTSPDGTMYIGGYYGPDPVAISSEGWVLWRADSGMPNTYWLYDLELTDDGVAAHYDCFNNTEGGGWVFYGWDGRVTGARAD